MHVLLFISCVVIFATAKTEAESPTRYYPGGPKGDLTTSSSEIASCWENRQILQELSEIKTLLSTVLSDEETGGDHINVQHQTGEDSLPTDCYDIYLRGQAESGVYTIYPNGSEPFSVYCDQDTDGGGWTVFQRRQDGSEDFNVFWDDYEQGFGSLGGEHWLGNQKLHQLTNQRAYGLRVDLGDFNENTRFAKYNSFVVAGPSDNYRLQLGSYSGDAGNAMTVCDDDQFSTWDRDNDVYKGKCARLYNGGWWYERCHFANLNGQYLGDAQTTQHGDGIVWFHFTGYDHSLKFTEMKLRPV